jgi:hypothetical protein
MGASMTVAFVLTGAQTGQTKLVGKQYNFVKGECVVQVPRSGLAHVCNYMSYFAAYPKGSPEHLADLDSRKGKNDGVLSVPSTGVQVGDVDLVPSAVHQQAGSVSDQESEHGGESGTSEAIGRDVQDERASDSTTGIGHEDSGVAGQLANLPSVSTASPLSRAITGLDPEVDENWTDNGLPAVSAVVAVLNDPSIGRKDITGAAPGWNRAKAREQAALF